MNQTKLDKKINEYCETCSPEPNKTIAVDDVKNPHCSKCGKALIVRARAPIDATIDYIATWLAKNKGQPSGENYVELKKELYNFASFVADELRAGSMDKQKQTKLDEKIEEITKEFVDKYSYREFIAQEVYIDFLVKSLHSLTSWLADYDKRRKELGV